MDVTVPVALTLTDTTVAVSAYDEWNDAASYSTGNRVVVTTAVPHYEYECVQAHTNKPPAANTPTYWVRLGATNQYRLLDDRTSSQTTDTTSITATVILGDYADRVCAFRLSQVDVLRVRAYLDGVQVAEVAASGREFVPASNWLQWWFGQSSYRRSICVPIPIQAAGVELEVHWEGPAGDMIGVGHLVAGEAVRIGRSILPLRDGITDYSVKDTDEWGETILVERDYADRISAEVLIQEGTRARVKRLLANLRATPCAWDVNDDGYDDDGLRLFGKYNEFEFAHDDAIVLTIDLEGLT